jgi:hypothetical protein
MDDDAGGLDDMLEKIFDECTAKQVPVVFCLSRSKLGKVLGAIPQTRLRFAEAVLLFDALMRRQIHSHQLRWGVQLRWCRGILQGDDQACRAGAYVRVRKLADDQATWSAGKISVAN